MYVGSDQIQSIIMARRLVLLTRQVEKQHQDPEAEVKSFKEIMEKDEIQLSGGLETRKAKPGTDSPSTNIGEYKPQTPSEGTTFEKLA